MTTTNSCCSVTTTSWTQFTTPRNAFIHNSAHVTKVFGPIRNMSLKYRYISSIYVSARQCTVYMFDADNITESDRSLFLSRTGVYKQLESIQTTMLFGPRMTPLHKQFQTFIPPIVAKTKSVQLPISVWSEMLMIVSHIPDVQTGIPVSSTVETSDLAFISFEPVVGVMSTLAMLLDAAS